jgi:hypothetical protein
MLRTIIRPEFNCASLRQDARSIAALVGEPDHGRIGQATLDDRERATQRG